MVEEPLVVEIHRPPHVLGMFPAPVATPALVTVGVPQGDARLGGQELDRTGEVEALGLAHEVDGIALGLTPEAVVDALLGVDGEGRRLLAVERAEPHPLGALLLELRVLGDDPDDVGLVADTPHVVVHYAHGPNVPPASGRLSGHPWVRRRGPGRQPGRSGVERDERLGHGQSGDRHPERRAGHVVHAGRHQQVDRGRVPAVLTAHAHL